MFAFARHEADISWAKLFMVFVPLNFTAILFGRELGLVAYGALVPCTIIALKLWFYLDWGKATLIAVVQVILTVAFLLGFQSLTS